MGLTYNMLHFLCLAIVLHFFCLQLIVYWLAFLWSNLVWFFFFFVRERESCGKVV